MLMLSIQDAKMIKHRGRKVYEIGEQLKNVSEWNTITFLALLYIILHVDTSFNV
jgi:hypothetical protein